MELHPHYVFGPDGSRYRDSYFDAAWCERQGLRTERRLLGLMLSWHTVPAADIARLSIKESYTRQSGSHHTTFYRLQVNLRDGRRVTIADSLRGRNVAEQMLTRVAEATGYPR